MVLLGFPPPLTALWPKAAHFPQVDRRAEVKRACSEVSRGMRTKVESEVELPGLRLG